MNDQGTLVLYQGNRGKDAAGEDRPTTIELPCLAWDDEAGWAAIGCVMPTAADLEGLSLDEREIRQGVAACGRRHTPESPCLADSHGVLFWVSVVDEPVPLSIISGPLLSQPRILEGGRGRTPIPPRSDPNVRRVSAISRNASERLNGRLRLNGMYRTRAWGKIAALHIDLMVLSILLSILARVAKLVELHAKPTAELLQQAAHALAPRIRARHFRRWSTPHGPDPPDDFLG